MRIEMIKPRDEYSPARWNYHPKRGNTIPKIIGDHLGFTIKVDGEIAGLLNSYQLVHTPIYQKTEKTEAMLLKIHPDRIQLLGRAKLPVDRLEGWMNNLLQDIESYHETSAIKLARNFLNVELKELATNGLNPVYKSWDEYFPDMWADLPWDAQGQAVALQWLVEQPELAAISKEIEERDGVKFKEYFEAMYASFQGDSNPERVDLDDHESCTHVFELCGFTKPLRPV